MPLAEALLPMVSGKLEMFGRRRMGSGETKGGKVRKLEELVLPNAKLRFCPEQLQNLNYIFGKRLERNLAPESGKDCDLISRRR